MKYNLRDVFETFSFTFSDYNATDNEHSFSTNRITLRLSNKKCSFPPSRKKPDYYDALDIKLSRDWMFGAKNSLLRVTVQIEETDGSKSKASLCLVDVDNDTLESQQTILSLMAKIAGLAMVQDDEYCHDLITRGVEDKRQYAEAVEVAIATNSFNGIG